MKQQILILELARLSREEIRRTVAQLATVPGVRSVNHFAQTMQARSLIGPGPNVSDYQAQRRQTEARRCQGKPNLKQQGEHA